MNKLARAMAVIDKCPSSMRIWLRSAIIGRIIPFAGTASSRFIELNNHTCVVAIRNKRKVGNHIGTLHAAAMALAAESATGFVMGINVPDDKLVVIKTMKLNYLKRTNGDLTATATLTDAHIKNILNDEKGEITVPVVLRDADNNETVTAEMTWAWTPKRR
ncbi:MAG: DUF4442 domain-containing protein [Oleibacter sp.]|nr:DUF4442 domain-containing protein [Thalassolituus sp.]